VFFRLNKPNLTAFLVKKKEYQIAGHKRRAKNFIKTCRQETLLFVRSGESCGPVSEHLLCTYIQ